MKNLTTPLAAFAAALLSSAVNASPSDDLVLRMAGPQSVVEKRFEAVPGIDGFVIKPANGKPVLVYVDQAGRFMFSGVLFDGGGQNLTRRHFETYIPRPDASVVLQEAEQNAWVSDGVSTAPALVYVAAEPNCGHCKRLYADLRPYVRGGKVEIRWLFTGFTPQAKRVSSALLDAKDAQQGLASVFSGAALPGGAENDPRIEADTAFMLKHGITGTPHLIYEDKSGVTHSQAGAVSGDALASLVNNATRRPPK